MHHLSRVLWGALGAAGLTVLFLAGAAAADALESGPPSRDERGWKESGIVLAAPGVPAPSPPTEVTPNDSGSSTGPAHESPSRLEANAFQTLGVRPDDAPTRPPEKPLDPQLRFVDPCAERLDGSCVPGVAASVREEGDGAVAPAFIAFGPVWQWDPMTDAQRECGTGRRDDGTLGVTLLTNNPATFEVHLSSLSGPELRLRPIEVATGQDQRDRWHATLLGGTVPQPDHATGVETCLELPEDVLDGERYQLVAKGTDDLGASYPHTEVLEPGRPASPGRPPLRLSALGVDRARVVALLDDDRQERLTLAELPRNGPDASAKTCTDIENDVLMGRWQGSGARTVGSVHEVDHPVIVARHDGQPAFDPRFDSPVEAQVRASEGRHSTICAWITTPADFRGHKPPVVQRTALDVRAPRWNRARVSIVGVRLDQPADWAVDARLGPRGRSVRIVEPGTGVGALDPPAPVVLDDSEDRPHDDSVVLELSSYEGTSHTLLWTPRYLCPTTPPAGQACSDHRQILTARIPGPRKTTAVCGVAFWESSCDPTTEETFLGEITLAVDTYAGPSGPLWYETGQGPWRSSVSSFAPGRGVPFPDRPEISTRSRATSTIPIGQPRATISLDLIVDRPVVARVLPRALPVHPRAAECTLPESATTTARTSISMELPGACTSHYYVFDVTLIDATGRSTTVEGWSPGRPLVTPDLYLDELSYSISVTPKASLAGFLLSARIADAHETLLGLECDALPELERTGVRQFSRALVSSGSHDMVSVRISGRLGPLAPGSSPCLESTAFDLSGDVPLADILDGTPARARFEDELLIIDVTIQGSLP